MLQGGQTPSWTCQMVFNPAHCPRSSAPFSSLSLCLVSFSGMFPSFYPPPLLFPGLFTHLHCLCFIPHTNLHSVSFFLNHTLITYFFLHTALSPPSISLFFPSLVSPLYILLFSFLTNGTWSLLSNTFSILKYIAPSQSSFITGHTHAKTHSHTNTHTHIQSLFFPTRLTPVLTILS